MLGTEVTEINKLKKKMEQQILYINIYILGRYIRKHTHLGTDKPKVRINDYCFRKIIVTIKHRIKLSLPVGV